MSSFNEDVNDAAKGGRRTPSGVAAAFNISAGERPELLEEQPTMRSVGMMGSGTDFSFRPSFSSLGPLSKASLGPPPQTKLPPKLSLRGSSFGVQSEWDEVITAPSGWNVKSENLEMVPEDFPLERTHREISGVDASKVASRISESVRVMSIDAKFDGDRASAKCKTSDLVKFRIRLYAGGEGGQPVVVELQRRSGGSSSFMKVCRAILDAAEGAVPKDPLKNKTLPPFMKGPVSGMNCIKSLSLKSSPEEDAEIALESALALFRSKNLDSNLLGLENLCCLTDPLKTSPSVARLVSRRIIIDEKNEIREDIGSLLQSRDVFPPECQEEEGPDEHMELLRHHALILFSNSLEVCSKDGCLADAVASQKWFEVFLVPSLVDEIKSASVCANSACQAVRCLQSLSSCSDLGSRLIVKNGGIDVLQEAREYALDKHELLASEAVNCLTTIETFSK